jgi:predicted GNAT family acetyltransferase
MTAVVQDNPDESRYEVYDDGELAGFALYKRSEGVITLTHTEVDDRFEGKGLGSALARGVLDEARRDGLAVLPYCPFMSRYIRGHADEYVDLVPEDQRAKFAL